VDAFSNNTPGSALLPGARDQVNGAIPPVAVSICEYGTLTWPFGSEVVVMTGGPGVPTMMVVVVSGTFGKALAWISVDPVDTPLTVTLRLVTLLPKTTDGGTVATLGLSELRFTVRPVGGGADRDSVTFWFEPGLMFTGFEEKLSVAPTCTVWVTVLYPEAVAVMVAEPKSMPHTWMVAVGAV